MLSRKEKAGFAVLALAAIAVIATPLLARAKAENGTVVAIVNGSKIFKSQVVSALEQNNVKSADVQKAFPIIVNEMINEKLISEAAKKADVENSPEYKQRLALAKEQLVKSVYLENYLKTKVTDSAVKTAYEKFKAGNQGKMEVHVRHILVKTKAEAERIIAELNHGSSFDTLAKEKSIDPSASNGGDVGWFTKDQLSPEFAAFTKAAFELKPGTYSQTPVHTQLGWHVIYVVGKRTIKVPPLKNLEAAIRNKLGQEAVQNLVNSLRAKADIKHFDMNGRPVAASKKG